MEDFELHSQWVFNEPEIQLLNVETGKRKKVQRAECATSTKHGEMIGVFFDS